MFTWLAELSPYFSPLNVFRYITFRTGGATATAMLIVFLFGPWMISLLRLRQGKGQPIREDGPQSHLLTKRGTPTMGGLMILSGVTVATMSRSTSRGQTPARLRHTRAASQQRSLVAWCGSACRRSRMPVSRCSPLGLHPSFCSRWSFVTTPSGT